MAEPRGARSLDEIADQLEKADAMLHGKVAALLETLNAEIAGKRVSASSAESLRIVARMIEAPTNGDARRLLAAIRLPAANEPLMRAVKDVEHEALATEIKREYLSAQAIIESRTRACELGRKAQTSADMKPFMAAVKRLENDAARHPAPGEINAESAGYEGLANSFRALSEGLDAGAGHDWRAIEKALLKLRASSSDASRVLYTNGGAILWEKLLAIPVLEMDRAQRELDNAMGEWRTPAEIRAELSRFRAAHEFCERFGSYGGGTIVEVYQKAVDLEIDLATSHTHRLDEQLADVRKYLMDPERCPRLVKFLPSLSEAITAEKEAPGRKLREGILEKITSVTLARDLDALCLELGSLPSVSEPQEENGGFSEHSRFRQALLASLATLRTAVRSGDFSLTERSIDIGLAGENPLIANALRDLRFRMECDALGETLRAPELAQLLSLRLPASAALDALCRSAADASDWQRALRILEIRDSPNFPDIRSPHSTDAAGSVRAFLAGQNFEAAEQWKDAVASYNSVLRRAAAHTPIQEAANRIKILRKAHPQAFISGKGPTP